MQAYNLVSSISGAEPYDDVIVTDGKSKYEIDYVRLDNGFIEIGIKEEGEKKEDKATCKVCGGTGSVPIGPGIRGIKRCDACHGTGKSNIK